VSPAETPWSPFGGAPAGGMEMRGSGNRCFVCGELITRGHRAFLAKPLKVRDPIKVTISHVMYPTHDGKIQMRATWRHTGCTP